MEALSPITLFSKYNHTIMPLDINYIKQTEEETYFESRFFFNGENSGNSVVRVYSRLLEPKVKRNQLLITALDYDQNIDAFDATPLLNRGFSVLLFDYTGIKDCPHYTIYPANLSYGNYYHFKTEEFPENLVKSSEFIWGTILLRCAAVASYLGYSLCSLLGVGAGGGLCYKLSPIMENIKSVATLFSFKEKDVPAASVDAKIINYKMSMLCESMTSYLRVPTLLVVGSNEQNNSLDKMSRLGAAPNLYSIFSICPKCNLTLDEFHYTATLDFLAATLNGEFIMPTEKKIAEFFESDDNTYIRLNAKHVTKPTLYTSFGIDNSAYRNWKITPLEHTDDMFFGKINAHNFSNTAYAYFDFFLDGIKMSTPVVSKTIKVIPANKKPLCITKIVYSAEELTAPFLSLKGKIWNSAIITTKEKCGIKGATSSNNSLTILSFGDSEKEGTSNNLLQISLFSDVEQTLVFRVADILGNIYICEKKVFKNEFWSRLNLSPSDFKGANLLQFENIVALTLNSSSEVLLNSILWI